MGKLVSIHVGTSPTIRIIPVLMKVALAQINPTVGDIAGNLRRIRADLSREAARCKADLVVFPELSLTGYPPRDLVEQGQFVERNRQALQELAPHVTRPAVIVGFVDTQNQAKAGKRDCATPPR